MLPPTHAQKPADLAKALAAAPQRLSDYAGALLADRPAEAVLVLFIDQFEELFTNAAERHRQSFIELIAHAARDPRLRVVATLRADFLPQCASEPNLAALLQAGTFPLGAPGPAALTDMIRKPAERAGLDLEEGLADEIVKDAGGDPGSLPLVAFCLEELYEKNGNERCLTRSDYHDIGGLRGAISRRAAALLVNFEGAEDANLDGVLPLVFLAMVHVDAAGKATRQRTMLDDLRTAPSPAPQLIDKLIKGRLLLTEEAGGQSVVMLAHEALLQEWSTLREWLNQNQAQLQRLQRAIGGLKSYSIADRRYGASTLLEMAQVTPQVVRAPPAAEVVLVLSAALSDVDSYVRRSAAEALGVIGSSTPEIVSALTTALSDNDVYVRRSAADALGVIGSSTPDVVSALSAALSDDTDVYVRRGAAEALNRLGARQDPLAGSSGL